MATSAFIADFGRLPTGRKVTSFVIAGLLLGLLYYRFVYQPLAEEAAAARAAYESTLRTHATGAASLTKYAELRPAMDKLREQLARNQAALPTEAEVPAFFETLERKVKESGVEIAKWTKRVEEPIESFVKVPVEIEITGTFMQIKRFFASLVQKNLGAGEGEERERIVSIESLVISQPQVRNREIFLAAKFVAVTFRQDEKAASGKPGAPAGPAAPPPLRPRGADPAVAPAPAGEPLKRGM
jgi:type IV pilus assembly protein PilO